MSGTAAKEQSKAKFLAATRPGDTPASTYKTSTGVVKPLKADNPEVVTVRRYVTHERYVTYDNRATTFYGNYYHQPVYYNDYFSPFLTGYMFSSAVSAHERAMWMYCHQPGTATGMDEVRYREMLARDGELRARIARLEAEKAPRNPNYVVPAYADNPDLQYNKEFVTAAVNPQPVVHAEHEGDSGVGKFFFWFFVVVIALSVAAVGVYFVAIKEYK